MPTETKKLWNVRFLGDVVNITTLNHENLREEMKVGAAYLSNVRTVREVQLEVAKNKIGLLSSKEPFAFLDAFDDSLVFGLYLLSTKNIVDQEINKELRFQVEVKTGTPFSQRQIHNCDNPNLSIPT